MHSLDDLLHPISPAQFKGDYVGSKPLHVPATGDDRKAPILFWGRFRSSVGSGFAQERGLSAADAELCGRPPRSNTATR